MELKGKIDRHNDFVSSWSAVLVDQESPHFAASQLVSST